MVEGAGLCGPMAACLMARECSAKVCVFGCLGSGVGVAMGLVGQIRLR